MYASIFTESNTLPPLIIISRVHFMNLETTPLSDLHSLTRRSVSINIPILIALKHVCKHFYRIQHSPTFNYHQPSPLHEFWKPHPFRIFIPLLDGVFLLIFRLQPNFTCPQTCMQTFLQNPTLSHL